MSGRHVRDGEVPQNQRCRCEPYPCDPDSCSWDCPVCALTGPVLSRSETAWRDTGEGLSEEEVERLRRSAGDHGASSTRLYGIRRDAQEDQETDRQDDKAT